jgi:hypothetical protein
METHPTNCIILLYVFRIKITLELNLGIMNRIKEVHKNKGIKQTQIAEQQFNKYDMQIVKNRNENN